MLAHNGNEQDRRYIMNSFSTSARLGLTVNLSAWATALIEIYREQGVDLIEDRYFRTAGRERVELDAAVQALSEHGSSGHTHLRPRIVDSYAVLLEHYPDMASAVASDAAAKTR